MPMKSLFLRARKIGLWVVDLLLAGLLVLLLLSFALPAWAGLSFRQVASGSMNPTIPLGSLVIIRPVNPDELLPGDIITFQSSLRPQLVVTHRIVEVTVSNGERVFRVKGDANREPDLDPVLPKQVLGRVIFHLPYLGALASYIRTRQGYALLVLAPAMTLIVIELVNIIKAIWTDGAKRQTGTGEGRST